MQVQHYIKPSKNEIKELDNSYNKKKMEVKVKKKKNQMEIS